MKRRDLIKIAAGAIAVGGAGVVTLTTAFKPEVKPAGKQEKLDYQESETAWKYKLLDPNITANIAYNNYNIGSCMYGVFSSIIAQLADKIGEPFASFPIHMMEYGHGGIGGNGTICGTLNGAAAVFGLLIDDKKVRDALIADLFRWYESTAFPTYEPKEPFFDFNPSTSMSKSVLCHVSTTRWSNKSGYRIESDERKERCRRLTAEVTIRTVNILNDYLDSDFLTNVYDNETQRTCLTCHGSGGKVGNVAGQMDCTACHTKSVGHQVFGDVHYKLMDKR